MITPITATFPTLNFPKEVDYPTQEDWAAFSAAAELNYGILSGEWSLKAELYKNQMNTLALQIQEIGENAINAISLDTIEDLATYTGAGLVMVKDINRGGTFVSKTVIEIDPNTGSLYVANGGTVFAKLGGGFWVRQYSGAVNVKWFGAKSILDVGYESFDSTISIQTALTYFDELVFIDIDCKTTTITVSSNKSLFFKNSSLTLIDGTAGHLLELNGSDILINGATFYANNKNLGYYFTANITNSSNVKIYDCVFNDKSAISINIASSNNVDVAGNTINEFIGTSTFYEGFGVVSDNSSFVTVERNKILGRNAGVVSLLGSNNLYIKHNHINGTKEIGIDLLACTNGLIIGNYVANTDLTSIRLGLESTSYPTSMVKKIKVLGNTIEKNIGTGYSISADVSADTSNDPRNTGYHIISKNTMSNYNINNNTSNTVIDRNIITNGGVVCSGRTRNVTISNNNISDFINTAIKIVLSVSNRQKGYIISGNILNNVGDIGKPAIDCWFVSGSVIKDNITYGSPTLERNISLPTGCSGSSVKDNKYYQYSGNPILSSNAFYATNQATADLILWEGNTNDDINSNRYKTSSLFSPSVTELVIPISLNYTPIINVTGQLGLSDIYVYAKSATSITLRRVNTAPALYFNLDARV